MSDHTWCVPMDHHTEMVNAMRKRDSLEQAVIDAARAARDLPNEWDLMHNALAVAMCHVLDSALRALDGGDQ